MADQCDVCGLNWGIGFAGSCCARRARLQEERDGAVARVTELEERLAITEEEWDKEHGGYRDRVTQLETWVKKAMPTLRKSMRILRFSDFTSVGQEAGQLLIDSIAVKLDDQKEEENA